MKQSSYYNVDFAKFVAALLVIAVHTGPLLSYDRSSDFLLTGIIARLAVPFFFMAAGFFFFRAESPRLQPYTGKIARLYAISILLFLPLMVYNDYFSASLTLADVVRDLVFDGPFYHLWYLPALIIGMVIVHALLRFGSVRATIWLTGGLYIIGVLGDSYYGLAVQSPVLAQAYNELFGAIDYTRNGLFFAPIFIAIGAAAARLPRPGGAAGRTYTYGLALSLVLLFAEGIMLHNAGWPRHDSMYLSLIPAVYCIFQLLVASPGVGRSAWWNNGAYLRAMSTWIYILHPAVIVAVRLVAKLSGTTELWVANSGVHYVAVAAGSILVSAALIYLGHRWQYLYPFGSGKRKRPILNNN